MDQNEVPDYTTLEDAPPVGEEDAVEVAKRPHRPPCTDRCFTALRKPSFCLSMATGFALIFAGILYLTGDFHEDVPNVLVDLMPKVELHRHFDGSFNLTHLWKFAKDNENLLPTNISYPRLDPEHEKEIFVDLRAKVKAVSTVEEFRASLIECNEHSLEVMLQKFANFMPIVRADWTLEQGIIEQLAYQFVEDLAQQHVVYVEPRYAPIELLGWTTPDPEGAYWKDQPGFVPETPSIDMVVEQATKGFKRGMDAYPTIQVSQILCCECMHPKWSWATVQAAKAYQNADCPVVAVDLASGETDMKYGGTWNNPEGEHAEAIQWAKSQGLEITIHAAESGPADHVNFAIDVYGAKRIGHGYNLLNNTNDHTLYDALLKRIKSAQDREVDKLDPDPYNIHFEACPTSSIYAGGWHNGSLPNPPWQDHPSKQMWRDGISVGLNTDDPTVFGTCLGHEYQLAVEKMGLNKTDIFNMNIEAIRHSFIPNADKLRLYETLTRWIQTHPDYEIGFEWTRNPRCRKVH